MSVWSRRKESTINWDSIGLRKNPDPVFARGYLEALLFAVGFPARADYLSIRYNFPKGLVKETLENFVWEDNEPQSIELVHTSHNTYFIRIKQEFVDEFIVEALIIRLDVLGAQGRQGAKYEEIYNILGVDGIRLQAILDLLTKEGIIQSLPNGYYAVLEKSPENLSKKNVNAKIEAGLLELGRAAGAEELSIHLNLPQPLVEEILRENTPRKITTMKVVGVKEDKYGIQSRPEFELDALPEAVIRTLYAIALLQPVEIATVILSRGSHAEEHLYRLQNHGLIRVEYVKGIPYVHTTEKFATMFKLNSGVEWMKAELLVQLGIKKTLPFRGVPSSTECPKCHKSLHVPPNSVLLCRRTPANPTDVVISGDSECEYCATIFQWWVRKADPASEKNIGREECPKCGKLIWVPIRAVLYAKRQPSNEAEVASSGGVDCESCGSACEWWIKK